MKLIILSDLYGNQDTNWLHSYLHILKDKFEIQFYDCCELGNIDIKLNDVSQIHNQFINGGIDKAVNKLLSLEKEEVSILGFSIGGLIGWKAALLGLNTNYFCSISSTRLRYETQKPNVKFDLFFAENDPFNPNEEWFEKMKIKRNVVLNETHDFYKKQAFANLISSKII